MPQLETIRKLFVAVYENTCYDLSMKLLLAILLVIPNQVYSDCDPISPNIRAIKAIEQRLKRNSHPKAVPAKELAPVILKLSLEYDVDPDTITRIILVESKGLEKAYNKHTKDYGLMQLNYHTMKARGINVTCALNWQCNLEQGIIILSELSRTCRYNVGSGSLTNNKLQRCLRYETKLAAIN